MVHFRRGWTAMRNAAAARRAPATDARALRSAACFHRASSGSRAPGIPPRAHGTLPPSGPRAHAPSHCGMRRNLLSWGPPPLSILGERLTRSFRSRCDCDHKNAFFHLGPAVRGAREKITFLKWVRGIFSGKNRSRKRGLIGANYGGDFSGGRWPQYPVWLHRQCAAKAL